MLGSQQEPFSVPLGNNFEVPMCISRLSETEEVDRESLSLIYLEEKHSQLEIKMLKIEKDKIIDPTSLLNLPY